MSEVMKKKKGFIQVIMAVALFLLSWWALLWVFSSSSLASEFCDAKFSLFHELARCRQPNIALIIWLVSGVASVVLLALGIKNIRGSANAT